MHIVHSSRHIAHQICVNTHRLAYRAAKALIQHVKLHLNGNGRTTPRAVMELDTRASFFHSLCQVAFRA